MWASPLRSLPVVRGGPHRAHPTDFYRKTSVGRGPCAPPKCKNRALLQFIYSAAAAQEGRRYYISCPLQSTPKRVGRTPTILNVRGALRKSRNPGFWRRFLYTFCRCWQKVCRRRHGDTDRPALPAYTAKLPDNARAGTPACCAGVPVSGASKSISRVLS